MQEVTGIGGVFFRARAPKRLIQWYDQYLGIDTSEKACVQDGGLTVFSPFNAESDYFGRQAQQWMICFRVADLGSMIAQLNAGGIETLQQAEWNSEVGTFARILDPEGNPIELWQPPDQ